MITAADNHRTKSTTSSYLIPRRISFFTIDTDKNKRKSKHTKEILLILILLNNREGVMAGRKKNYMKKQIIQLILRCQGLLFLFLLIRCLELDEVT